MYVLGINALGPALAGHNPGAALLKDGRIIALAEEERFIREKYAEGRFPFNAIAYCLRCAGIGVEDVDVVAWYSDPIYAARMDGLKAGADKILNYRGPGRSMDMALRFLDMALRRLTLNHARVQRGIKTPYERLKEIARRQGVEFLLDRLEFVPHHYAHASSAYYPSGQSDSTVITWDGGGDGLSAMVCRGHGATLRVLKEYPAKEFNLGGFYETVSAYLGLEPGMTMGLASYGQAKGQYFVKYAEAGGLDVRDISQPTEEDNLRYNESALMNLLGPPPKEEINFPIPKKFANIAAEAQALLEDKAMDLLDSALEAAGTHNLCLAGGVALNSVLNGKISKREDVRKIYIPPNPRDSGTALGAAISAYIRHGGTWREDMRHAYWGPSFDYDAIKVVLKRWKLPYSEYGDLGAVADETVRALLKGKVVGWFQGREEWGPRALGHRSILADPRSKKIADTVNKSVKKRQPWRPFAPTILYEHCDEWFEHWVPSPFMSFTFKVRANMRDKCAGVVHVDGTTRPQTLERDVEPTYYELIESFYNRTGVPMLLNTSFNLRGEPIVGTPEDAIRTFYTSGMDVLVIGQFVLTKSH